MALLLSDGDIVELVRDSSAVLDGFASCEAAIRTMASAPTGFASHQYLPMHGGERYSLLVHANPSLGTSIRSFPADGTSRDMDGVTWMMIDPRNGALAGLFTSGLLSALRTAFPSVTGARLLATDPVRRISLIGSGRQARAHALLLGHAFPELVTISCWSPTPSRREVLTVNLRQHVAPDVEVAETCTVALRGADVVFLLGAPGSLEIGMDEIDGCPVIVRLGGGIHQDILSRADVFVPGLSHSAAAQDQDHPSGRPCGAIHICDMMAYDRSLVAERRIRVLELGGLYGWDAVIAQWALANASLRGLGRSLCDRAADRPKDDDPSISP